MARPGNPGLSDEECLEALNAYNKAGANQAQAAKALGIPRPTFVNRLDRAFQRGLDKPIEIPSGMIVRGGNTRLDKHGEYAGESIQIGPDHGGQFEVPEGHAVKGVSYRVDANGNSQGGWVKTRAEVNPVDVVRDALEGKIKRAKLIKPPKVSDADLLTVYPIADQHVGMLSWAPETGENYDLDIACDRLRDALSGLVSASPNSEAALIPQLGDFFHMDDGTNRTPASKNVLDADGRLRKVIQTGIRLMCDCVDLALQKHKRVIVRNIPGNHDPNSSLILDCAMIERYRDDPRVEIIEDASEFLFHEFGQTLIGGHHGHRMKPDRMASLLADNQREAWGRTKYRWFLFGHFHHDSVKDVGSVRCESFRTLAAKDAYAASSGYTTPNSMQAITLHKERGEVSRQKVTI